MSFGYSVADAFLLGQLTWKILQNSRKACGEHDELTKEVSTLHTVLRRLGQEVEKAESPINSPGGTSREELQGIVGDCGSVLVMLDKVLEKYAALSEEERSTRKLWKAVRFGNGKMADLGDLRSKVTFYTSAITLYLNLVSIGSAGRIERYMVDSGGIIRDIQLAVNTISARSMSAGYREGSVLTSYTDDDRAVWKEFRRDLIGEGFKSSVIHEHKTLIQAYVRELGSRGAWDVGVQEDIGGHPDDCSLGNEVREAIEKPSGSCGSVDEVLRDIAEHSDDRRSGNVETRDMDETEAGPRAPGVPRNEHMTEMIGESSVFTNVRSSVRSLTVGNEPISAALGTNIDHSRTETTANIQSGSLNDAVELARLWYLFYDQFKPQFRRWASAMSHIKPDRVGETLITKIQLIKAKLDTLDAENMPDPDFLRLQHMILNVGLTLSIMTKFTSQPRMWKKYRWLARWSETRANQLLAKQITDEELAFIGSIGKSVRDRTSSCGSLLVDRRYLHWGPMRASASLPKISQ